MGMLTSLITGIMVAGVIGYFTMVRQMVTADELTAAQAGDTKAREVITQQIIKLQEQLIAMKEEQIKRGPFVNKIPALEAGLEQLSQKFAAFAVAQEQLLRIREDIGGMRVDLKELTKELREEIQRRMRTGAP